MPLLSVAIITLNEEVNLARTLPSVVWADEIVVVDSGSTDRTVEIALSFNAKVIYHEWQGFATQKNFAISQCTGDWVLSLDADEELSPELQSEIQNLLSVGPSASAFYIRRRNMFLGRWIRHGGFYPDSKLRLFRHNSADTLQSPQFQERPVHETITFSGAAATLNCDLIHHAYPTLSTYIEHMDRYSSLAAELLIEKGRTSSSFVSLVTNVLLVPQIMFWWNYIFKLGFLDGREGLLLHMYHATYTSWKYSKAWEASRTTARD